jgi:predicted transcriptional regulator of viral defense system
MVKKLNRIHVQERLKDSGLVIFTPREFYDVFGIPPKTGAVFISRNLKSGLFLKLRNNYYMLKDSRPPLYAIANKLYQPSYVSLESALSHYGIIPETVYAVTSVTAKPTREFKTPQGVFSYQRIKKSVFGGYNPVSIEGNIVLLAQPEKALADYLYFVDLKKVSLNDRLNLKNIRKGKLLKFIGTFRRASLRKKVKEMYAQQGQPRKIY